MIFKQLRTPRGSNPISPSSLGGANLLEKAGAMRGVIPKLIAWWAIGEMTWTVGSKIYEFLKKPEGADEVSFCVDDGTQEHAALLAMAAVYLDKEQTQSAVFKLEKQSSKKEAFKPVNDCIMLFKGRHIRVTKHVPENQVSMSSRTFWIAHVHVEVLDAFLEEFDKYMELSGNVSDGIYRWSGWSWRRVASMPENRVVILPEGHMENVLNDAKKFLAAKEWYFEKGIPWRKGYEFYGLPGTGKTSMAICMAINLKRSLYCVSSRECSGSTFEDAMRELPRGAVVLIEDIDCIFDGSFGNRKSKGALAGSTTSSSDPVPEEDNKMTLSDFLNAVDGVTSQKDGRILILTTNHHERLDPAIIRPGRIDVRVEFKHADLYQLNLLSQRMLGEKDGIAYFKKHFKNRKTKITMAEAENMLLPVALAQIDSM